MIDIESLKKDCRELLSSARIALDYERNYQKSYDQATQAQYLAKNIFTEDLALLINILIYKGLALMGLDKDKGYCYIEEVYFNYKDKVNTKDDDLKLTLKSAFAQAKAYIGEYKESIGFLIELIKDTRVRLENITEENNEYERYIRRIVSSMIRIAYSLIYLNREEHYPDLIKKTEAMIKSLSSDLGDIDLKDLAQEVNLSSFDPEVNCELTRAMRYLRDGEKLALESGFIDLVTMCEINKACIYVEKEDYKMAVELLEKLKDNESVKKCHLGHVLNELAIAKINLGDFSEVEEILKESWKWLSEQKYYEELARSCYAMALYNYKHGKLATAYSFADLANMTKNDLPYIRLLYQISFLKYVSANRQGNESEYIFFKNEYHKYKAQLERRG